ncbi:hypothetical protein NL676_007710 [Syzygium grande]|nr:hypothetical protein NL676_007710 [Syzygium grande]
MLVGQPAKQRETNRGLAEDVGGALWLFAGATTAWRRLPRSGAAVSSEGPVPVDSSRGARLRDGRKGGNLLGRLLVVRGSSEGSAWS